MAIDPGLRQFATEQQLRHIDAIEQYGSGRAAAAALGLSHNTMNEAMRRLYKSAALRGYSPKHDMVHTVPDGFAVKGVSTYYDKDGKARGQWVKSTQDAAAREEILRAMVEGLKDEITPIAPRHAPLNSDDDLLTIYPIGDPHAGLYAWKEETGVAFDLREFERVNKAAIDRIVEAAPRSSIAIFNDKGDSTHADDNTNRTPRSGHALDVHGRHAEVVRVSVKIKRYQIERLLDKHAKVIVRVDSGNHDPISSIHLAMLLEALYENEPRVEVITSPNPYWYYKFGKNLIGTCHGDGAKGKDLPGIMANDVREWWGQSDYCVWFVGHVHHKDIKDYTGCTVEYMRTLAASDAWHHGQGYRARRSIEAITLHKDGGEEERQTRHVHRF
jgi:hypothetical protein